MEIGCCCNANLKRLVLIINLKVWLKALANEDTSCGHIVAHDVSWARAKGGNECRVSMLRKLGNFCCGHKMFLNKIRNIFCVPETKFVSATNVARAGKRGNICIGNNVSATMCPRLPGH